MPLCHLFKLFERLVLKRISQTIETKLIKQQAGFRGGKSYTGQVLNVTQYIQDDFEKNKITGAAFVDISAACDTINHQL